MINKFVIGDQHLGHTNIRIYEPMRQAWGPDVNAMTEVMILAWQSVVGPEDTVYHMGDVMMGQRENWPKYRARLTGKIILIQGNHDKKPEQWLLPCDTVQDRLELIDEELGVIIMRHDPNSFTKEEYNRVCNGKGFFLHGHLHSNGHRGDTPEYIQDSCVCLSIERLPTAPAPMPWSMIKEVHIAQQNARKSAKK